MEHELVIHETMDIHELLNFKTVCLLTSKMIQGIVFDQELKALLEKDVALSTKAVHTLQTLYTKTKPQ